MEFLLYESLATENNQEEPITTGMMGRTANEAIKEQRTCKYYEVGKCCRENCSFVHEDGKPLNNRKQQKWNNQAKEGKGKCWQFQKGNCKYGKDCIFAHSEETNKKTNNASSRRVDAITLDTSVEEEIKRFMGITANLTKCNTRDCGRKFILDSGTNAVMVKSSGEANNGNTEIKVETANGTVNAIITSVKTPMGTVEEALAVPNASNNLFPMSGLINRRHGFLWMPDEEPKIILPGGKVRIADKHCVNISVENGIPIMPEAFAAMPTNDDIKRIVDSMTTRYETNVETRKRIAHESLGHYPFDEGCIHCLAGSQRRKQHKRSSNNNKAFVNNCGRSRSIYQRSRYRTCPTRLHQNRWRLRISRGLPNLAPEDLR
eukprot:Lankesteria_metandrocarpae@DN4854_c0_g1_i2.p1